MSDTRDPGAAIKRLAERLGEEAEKVGLSLRGFSFNPNMDGEGPHMVQAVFAVGELTPELTPEQELAAADAALLTEMERSMRISAEAEQVAHATKTLEALRDDLYAEDRETFLAELEADKLATPEDILSPPSEADRMAEMRRRMQDRIDTGGGLLDDED